MQNKCGFKGVLFFTVLVAMFLPSIGFAADDIKKVRATGSAAIVKGDVEDARKEAINDAKRNAVDKVGSEVISKTIVENFELVKDQIITKLDGYVHGYDIVEEKKSGKNYVVKILAEVSKKALVDDATLIYHDMDKPRLMIIIPEIRGKEIYPTSQAENVVSEYFVEKGFTLIDQATAKVNLKKDELRRIAEGDERAAAKIALRAGAEAIVVGSAAIGDVEKVKGVLYASKATVSMRALRSDNASLYAVSTKSKSAADGVSDAAQRKALEKTSRAVSKDIFWKIVKKWNSEKLMGSDIEMLLSGVSFSKLSKVKKGFKGIKGVTDVIQRSFDSPAAVISVTYKGDAMRLAEIIDESDFKGFKAEILSVTPGKMSLKIK